MPTHGRIHQAPSCPLCALKNSPKIEHRSAVQWLRIGIRTFRSQPARLWSQGVQRAGADAAWEPAADLAVLPGLTEVILKATAQMKEKLDLKKKGQCTCGDRDILCKTMCGTLLGPNARDAVLVPTTPTTESKSNAKPAPETAPAPRAEPKP